MLFRSGLMRAAGGWQVAGLVAARVVVAVVPVGALAIARQVIDAVAASRARGAVVDGLAPLIVAELAIVATGAFAVRLWGFFDALCADRFGLHVSQRILAHAARLDQATYEDPTFYDRLERARAQATDRFVMIRAIGDLGQHLITATALALAVGAFAPAYVAVLIACTVPVFVLDSAFALRWYALRLAQTPDRRRLDYLRQLGSSREAAKEVRLFALGPIIGARYAALARSLYDQVRRLQLRKLACESVVVLSTAGQYAIYGAVVYQAARGALSLGALTFLVGAVAGCARAIQDVFVASTSVADQALFVSDLREFLAVTPRVVSPPDGLSAPRPIRAGFELHDVTFVYPGTTRRVLDRVSLTLRPGETVALVGENGEGKTTLVKLLLRLFDPSEGRITLDGVDLRAYDLADLHRQISAIFQDFVRYEASFHDNVVLGAGAPAPSTPTLATALRWSQADDVLARLPGGLDQVLGRRFVDGVDLSGGEWQRVALARAYLRPAQIVVLDEPSAALDARAERALFERFTELVRGKLALLISHRFSTVRTADRILVLADGRIAEHGTHAELMARRGRYHELYSLQATSYQDPPAVPGEPS